MNELKDFYKTSLRLTCLLLIAFVIYSKSIIEIISLKENPIILIVKIATSSIVVTFLFIIIELIIRKQVWKLPFIHRNKNFDGVWLGITLYDEKYTLNTLKENFDNFTSKHTVNIKQDCLTFIIEPSPSKDYTSWSSLTAELKDNNEINFTYEVQYLKSINLMGNVVGFSKMKVTQKTKTNLPIVLIGKFSHFLEPNQPLYKGVTVFLRKDKLDKINANELIEFAKNGYEIELNQSLKRQE